YVPEEEFARIVKHVKRNKRKKQEDRKWLKFLASINNTSLYETGLDKSTYMSSIDVSEHDYSKEKPQIYIPHQKHFDINPTDEIVETEVEKRKLHLEYSTKLKDLENVSDNTFYSHTHLNKCIHETELSVEAFDHNSEVREEFPLSNTNPHCALHKETNKRNGNFGVDIQNIERISAENNDRILPAEVAPTSCKIHESNQEHVTNNKDPKLSNFIINNNGVQCSNCGNEKNINFLPVEADIPKCGNCGIQSNELNYQISPTEENVNVPLIQAITPKLIGACYSSQENTLPSEQINSKLNDCECQTGRIHEDISNVEMLVPKMNLQEIQRDGAYSQRIRNIRKNIDRTLDSLLEQLPNIPEPDGSQDMMRRRKRAVEFSARFARNYLFHLSRQICEIRKEMKDSSSTHRGQHTSRQALYQKLVSAHQTALQGLQAYVRHIPSSVRDAATAKMKEFFQNLTEVSQLCSKLVSSIDSGTEGIEKKIIAVLELIDGVAYSRNVDNDTASSQESVSVMTTTGRREWASSLRETKKESSTRDSCTKPALWKDIATKLARAAYGSPYKKRHFAFKTHKQVGVSKTGKKAEQSSKNLDRI
ncbi:hypothetical protein L9F63_007968, partial [Diploptera punctata]